MKAEEFYEQNRVKYLYQTNKELSHCIMEMMEQYAELRIQQEREKWKEETKHKYWHKGYPSTEMSVICRMFSGYIKMCHWTGEEWLDMWSDKLEGDVVEWMFIPND